MRLVEQDNKRKKIVFRGSFTKTQKVCSSQMKEVGFLFVVWYSSSRHTSEPDFTSQPLFSLFSAFRSWMFSLFS